MPETQRRDTTTIPFGDLTGSGQCWDSRGDHYESLAVYSVLSADDNIDHVDIDRVVNGS